MDWAAKRKWTVIAILVAIVLSVLLILGFAIFYETPTCFDRSQNQDETGIDCGGSCTTLCSLQAGAASVRFTRTLMQSGRTDVIAYIDNPNRDAYSTNAHVTLEAYDENGAAIERHVSVTILPGAATPLYLPGIAPAGSIVRQAFVTFDDGYPVWTKAPESRSLPTVSVPPVQTPETSPRITATVMNTTAYVQRNIPFVATVFADDGSAMAASQTILTALPAQGTASITFTWNEPFPANPARVEIVPLMALPTILP